VVAAGPVVVAGAATAVVRAPAVHLVFRLIVIGLLAIVTVKLPHTSLVSVAVPICVAHPESE